MKIFNRNAKAYQAVRSKITYPRKLYAYLNTLCTSHNLALDIGCGNGVSSCGLMDYFQQVAGIDIGDKLIAFAKENYPHINFAVSSAEELQTTSKFDLITSATSFYWMDRSSIIGNLPNLLNDSGIFCVYKYDFPVIYGELRDFINFELATKWQPYRDKRLIEYDDTFGLLSDSQLFSEVEEFIIPNILELTPLEIGQFFLSTSYVANFINETQANNYAEDFLERISSLAPDLEQVKVRFDIFGVYAKL